MEHGIVIGAGHDSAGYLSRIIQWMATKSPHTGGRPPQYNWRSGTARSSCGLGFSLLYYQADSAFHEFLKGEGLAEIRSKECKLPAERFVSIEDADPLLLDLVGEQRDLRLLRHYMCSFVHTPERDFVDRLYLQLSEHRVSLVQHDSIMVEAPTRDRHGKTDHALRCYVPADRGMGWFVAAMERCLKQAALTGAPQITSVKEPEADRGIVVGKLPAECRRDGRPLACLYFVAQAGPRPNAIGMSRLDQSLERSLQAMRLMGGASHIAETMRDTTRGVATGSESRPIVRMSIRNLGGWIFGFVCVPVADEAEANSLGVILQRTLGVDESARLVQCRSFVSRTSPWAPGQVRRSLGKLRHADRAGYLADYFAHIDGIDALSQRVSVIQYDSWAQAIAKSGGRPNVAHRFCVAATDPMMDEAHQVRLLETWEARHEAWAQANG